MAGSILGARNVRGCMALEVLRSRRPARDPARINGGGEGILRSLVSQIRCDAVSPSAELIEWLE